MSIQIIKPRWNNEIEAYIVTIDGQKYILDIEAKQPIASSAPAQVKPTRSMKKRKKTGKRGKPNLIREMIATGASFKEVKAKFPKLSSGSFYQYRKRLGIKGPSKN